MNDRGCKIRLDQDHTLHIGISLLAGLLALIVVAASTRLEAQTVSPSSSSSDEVQELKSLVLQLQDRVADLEAQEKKHDAATQPAASSVGASAQPASTPSTVLSDEDRGVLDFFHDTTLNLTLDTYYAYNFNRPAGRINLLRAYDVSSNSFSLNQATVVLERAADPSKGRRFGARLDLQYGQATESSQGNPVNELRPQTYRPIWQAYGTYIAPVGKGLAIDFGKWASPLGIESNYTKDQVNYSRSYLFNLMPFYHTGVRANYSFNNAVSLGYAVVNGIQQAEDFNGFKSQMVFVGLHPSSQVSWNINYYAGQEQRDVVAVLNPGFPMLPTQPGLPVTPVTAAPDGWTHIIDSNATWTPNARLTLAGEADYVISRNFSHSAPVHVTGGAGYIRHQLTSKAAVAARAEYLSDRGGFFSGTTQALKETTLTYEYKVADGFLARTEWRRDFSNQPFFLGDSPSTVKKAQNTATLGLVWWWGRKQGAW